MDSRKSFGKLLMIASALGAILPSPQSFADEECKKSPNRCFPQRAVGAGAVYAMPSSGEGALGGRVTYEGGLVGLSYGKTGDRTISRFSIGGATKKPGFGIAVGFEGNREYAFTNMGSHLGIKYSDSDLYLHYAYHWADRRDRETGELFDGNGSEIKSILKVADGILVSGAFEDIQFEDGLGDADRASLGIQVPVGQRTTVSAAAIHQNMSYRLRSDHPGIGRAGDSRRPDVTQFNVTVKRVF